MKQSGYINNLDNGFFMCALFIGIILAVFCSLFIGTEHNDGTIRNKIIVGQNYLFIKYGNLFYYCNYNVYCVFCSVSQRWNSFTWIFCC